jgi:hypothetical protein
MKNKTLIVAIAVMVLTLSACKKNYTCECSTTTTFVAPGFGNFPFPSKSEDKAYSKKMTKKQAEAACEHEGETIESIMREGFADTTGSGGAYFTVNTKCSLD